jgi:hypothetical protein
MKKGSGKHPRILVVNGEPFNRQSATGFTMVNLFAGWPSCGLAQVYSSAIAPDPSACEWGYRLEPRDLLFKPVNRSFLAHAQSTKGIDSGAGSLPPRDGRNLVWLRGRLRREASALSDLVDHRLGPEFWAWLDVFRPELVYSMLGSLRLMSLADRIAARYAVSVVPHFMDDWVTRPYRGLWASRVLRGPMHRSLRRLLRRSNGCLAISEKMASHYQDQFGRPFTAFMNCVPSCLFRDISKIESQRSGAVEFAYIGNLQSGRLELLRLLAETTEALVQDGFPVHLTLYLGGADRAALKAEFSASRSVRVCPSPDDQVLPSVHAASDVFVHLDSFRQEEAEFFKYSLSSKIPLYLAGGRPILAFGPSSSSSMEYLEKSGAAMTVTVRQPAALRQAMDRLTKDVALREQLGRVAAKLGRTAHEASSQQERFRETLKSLAEGSQMGV